jgi:hypothetical protein
MIHHDSRLHIRAERALVSTQPALRRGSRCAAAMVYG